MFFLLLILQSTCFICITWKRKQTTEQQPYRSCEWTKSNKNKRNEVTSYSNCPHVLLFDLVHKQYNGIIKGWPHCLTWESRRRFLANNILLAWCLIMVQIQFSLIKKIKTGRPEHSLTLHSSMSANISYTLPPPPPQLPTPLKVDVICVLPLNQHGQYLICLHIFYLFQVLTYLSLI